MSASDQEWTARFTQAQSCVDAQLREDTAVNADLLRQALSPVPPDTVAERRSNAYCASDCDVAPFGSHHVQRRTRQQTGEVATSAQLRQRTYLTLSKHAISSSLHTTEMKLNVYVMVGSARI